MQLCVFHVNFLIVRVKDLDLIALEFNVIQVFLCDRRLLDLLVLDEHGAFVLEKNHALDVAESAENVVEHFHRDLFFLEPPGVYHLGLSRCFQKQRIDVVSGVHVTGDIFVQLRRLGCIAFGVLILLRLFARLAEVGLGGVFLIFLVPDGMEGWCVRLLYLWLEAARGRLVAAIRLKWHGVRIDQRLLHFAPTDQRIDLLDALFSLLHDLVTDVFFNYVDHVLLLLLLVGGNLALRPNVLQ